VEDGDERAAHPKLPPLSVVSPFAVQRDASGTRGGSRSNCGETRSHHLQLGWKKGRMVHLPHNKWTILVRLALLAPIRCAEDSGTLSNGGFRAN